MGVSARHATLGRRCGNAPTALAVTISAMSVSGFVIAQHLITESNVGRARSLNLLGFARLMWSFTWAMRACLVLVTSV